MIRLCATLLLTLALSLMPLAMTGGAAMGAVPAATAAACPDHHQPQHQQQPESPVAPQDKGALHCQMCAALPQPDQAEMPDQVQASAGHATVSLPQLAGIADEVSVPPPRNA